MASRLAALLLCFLLTVQFSTDAQQLPTGSRTHWNKSRGFAPFRYATADCIIIDDTIGVPLCDSYKLRETTKDFSLRFTASNSHNHPAKSYSYRLNDGSVKKVNFPAWQFYVKDSDNDSLIVCIKTKEVPDALSSATAVIVSAYHSSAPLNRAEVTVNDGIDCFNGYNNWQLSVKDGIARVSGGNRSMKPLFSIPVKNDEITEFGFTACPGACLKVSNITFTDNSVLGKLESSKWADLNYLEEYLATSKDPMEGYWTIFDRDLEESLLQLGGDYRFVVVKDEESYSLIYMGGARINEGIWKPGMIKASLIPEPFPGIFNVVWYDTQGLPMSKDIKAQKGEGETLTIQFPYQSSSLRLRRLPQ